jgi:hypothetical protein
MIAEILFGNPTLYEKIISLALRVKDVKSRLWSKFTFCLRINDGT